LLATYSHDDIAKHVRFSLRLHKPEPSQNVLVLEVTARPMTLFTSDEVAFGVASMHDIRGDRLSA
jgi:hypothetical protein